MENGAVEEMRAMFGPLNLRECRPENLPDVEESPCLICDDVFNLRLCFDVYLKHLFEVHRIVVEDIQNITGLSSYLRYWKDRLRDNDVGSVVPAIEIAEGVGKYYVFSTLLDEDKQLRTRLNLERVLDVYEFERADVDFKRACLFCRYEHHGTRTEYLVHLSQQHNLQLGNPQNLVFVDELLDRVERNFADLRCLYCEKTFTDRAVLKEHMRKKLHKRVNPNVASYDRYYIRNYLDDRDKVRGGSDVDDVPLRPGHENSDDEYSDWTGAEDEIQCLFCEETARSIGDVCEHMVQAHGFPFGRLVADLDYYGRVKIVNFVRRSVHLNRCFHCDAAFGERTALRAHLNDARHDTLPENGKFDQPEYYFPTYEDDAFLRFLDDLESQPPSRDDTAIASS